MSFLKKLFSEKSDAKAESCYLAGWEVELDGEADCLRFIETQIVEKSTAKNLHTYIELQFGPDKLLKNAKLFSDGEHEGSGNLVEHLQINRAVGKLKHQNWKTNQPYDLLDSETGLNYLGGEIPSDFKIPENKCPGSFQYLGKLSHKDSAFDWLPFDLHLICPIYLDIEKVWVDYTDPLNPQILNKEEIENTGTAYNDLKSDSFIQFEQLKFKTTKVADYGFTGVPKWMQYPEIPVCPKSQKTMKFLCQISDYIEIKVAKTNVQTEVDSYKGYFEKMNFWGDGDLFVFFEPKTKIACYFIQNT